MTCASSPRSSRRRRLLAVAELAAIGIVTKNMGEAARFYRLLGLDVPEPDGDHLEATLPNGLRLMSHEQIVAAGFRSKDAPYDAFWGQRYATVLDPDDNPVDLFAQL